MRRIDATIRILRPSGVVCMGLFLVGGVVLAQPGRDESPREGRSFEGRGFEGRGFEGRGRGRFGFGFGEPSLSRELRRESFAQKINLTEEQKQLMNDLDMQRGEYFRSLPRTGAAPGSPEFEKRMQDMQAKMKEFDGKAIEILTAEQKSIWEERKAEIKAEQGDRGEPRPSSDGAAPSQTPQPPPRRTAFTDEKPPAGTSPTASFAARGAGNPATDNGVPEKSTGPGTGTAKDGETVLSFNFRYAPWEDVLKLFAEAAGLTLDLNDVPLGTFNYYDDKTYTVTEALDVLNGYLLPKGYVLIRRDRFLVSLNIDYGIPPSLIPTITVDELPSRGANELVIVDVPLEGFEVDKIVGDIKELTGPWGKVAAMKNTNSLNIMDTGSNISRIVRLLKAGGPVDNRETAFRAIALKHITAAEAERTVRRLFGLNPTVSTGSSIQPQFGFTPFGGGFSPFGGFDRFRDRGDDRSRDDRGRDDRSRDFQRQQAFGAASAQSTQSPFAGKIQVTADTRTNHLLVTASASLVRVVEDAVKTIDVDTGEKPVDYGPAFLKAYVVAGGDVNQVAQTLNAMMPGLVVGVDSRSSKVHVQANREEHSQIERLIQTLAGEISGSVAVINLQRADPVQVTNTLRNLFASDPKPPTIEADALGRRLLVRGTAEQLAQVKSLLQSLGETGDDPQAETAKVDRGKVRRLNLGGRPPEDVLPLIRQMWEAADRSPIRVVVPSQPNPVRERRIPGARSLDTDPAETNSGDPRPEAAQPASRKVTQPQRTGPSTQSSRRTSILQVSQSGAGRATPNAPVIPEASGNDDRPAPPTAADTNPEQAAEPKDGQTPSAHSPISISIVGDEIVIIGDDTDDLDQLEDMINNLAAVMPVRTRWTVFYLRSADATDTAQMLERLFPQSNVTSTTANTGGMLQQLTGGLSSMGRSMMSATGLEQTLGGANNLRIITDTRANALFVTGPQDQINEVESMLELLDSSELPESLRDRVPRTIPVRHADLDEVADIVQSVFKDALTPENPQGQGNAQRFNPLAMLMGGGGGNGAKDEGVRLTVGVDRRTSHLIVACNETLFRQIEGLVNSIDERARDARQTVQILKLETADPALVSSTLTSLIPKVTISASRGGNRKGQPGMTDPNQQAGGGQPPDAVRDPDLIRRAMEQRRGSSSGRTFGSGRSFGSGSRDGSRGSFGGGGGGRGSSRSFGGSRRSDR